MPEKPPEDNSGLLALFKKLWLPVAGFLGAVTLAYNFYQLWLGDQTTVTYFLAGGGLLMLVIALGWVVFNKKTVVHPNKNPLLSPIEELVPRYSIKLRWVAWGLLFVIFIGVIISSEKLIQKRQTVNNKLVVLITAFEGPEDVYGLRNEIVERLNNDFSDDEDIQIVIIDDVITLTEGSDFARKLGKKHQADVVIWGWYRPTENPNISIHIENLSPAQLLPLKGSSTLQPITTLAELDSFTFQQQTGKETSALISFLAGYVQYRSRNFDAAIVDFDRALENIQSKTQILVNGSDIYYYRANSKLHIEDYEQAIVDYDKAIEINPQEASSYNNRGIACVQLGQYERAIQDLDKAIELNPQLETAYTDRGLVYDQLGQHERAIQDYNKAIEINPEDATAYYNRGHAYAQLQQYERAIQDYNKVIEINPQDAKAYYNRGSIYVVLAQYERAIQDFDKAIEISPRLERVYNNRGLVYAQLGQYKRAIQDYNTAIEIDPQDTTAYVNRGVAYYQLGEYNAAVQDYDKAIEINPQDALAYYNRWGAYQKLGKTTEAEADYMKYEELTGQKP